MDTKYFAVRYANKGIRVNGIAPGGVLNRNLQGEEFITRYSQLVPSKKLCSVSEVAQLVYLMSEPGLQYLTGQTILLDGGMSAW